MDGPPTKSLEHLISAEGLELARTYVLELLRLCASPSAIAAFLSAHPPALISLGGALLLGQYFLVAHLLVSRTPGRRETVASESMPSLSPAAARYVSRRGFDDRGYAAALLGLAAKGHLTIEGDDGAFVLRRTTGGGEELGPDETELLAALFLGGATLPLSPWGRERVRAGEAALRKALATAHDGESFTRNRRLVVAGVVIFLATCVAMALTAPHGRAPLAGFMMVWLSIWTVGVVGLVGAAGAAYLGIFKARGLLRRLGALLVALFMTAFALPFLAGQVFGMAMLASAVTPIGLVGFFVSIALLAGLPRAVLVATDRGGAMLDEIDDYAAFLSTPGNWHPLLTHDGPAEAFARHLPYAFALDLTEAWAARFGGSLGAFLGPPWLLGPRGERLDSAALTALLAGPFSTAVTGAARRRAS